MREAKETSVAPHPVLSDYYQSGEERRKKVDAMFDSSARHYDWITKVMSFGSGGWYRRQALLRVGVGVGHEVLDVGAGTGEVSLIEQQLVGDQGLVVALDPSKGMLSVAVENGVKRATLGLGEALPFPDNTFDFVTMSYALRHVADLQSAFEEYRRVLKPDGKILLLEITRPEGVLSTFFLKIYMKGLIPTITRLFRGSKEAEELMRYYWDTIDQCVPPTKILEAMASAGVATPQRHKVMGIFSEYTGTK
ncbi:demethylmenaquinone methyltransferase/2-methoxy-6-polyprenyl-1,4-benzoquinol methylase [Alteromonadaceae bacterium 2753L.S.0a.02]|nr:demethylmenaquinone methyltransferase/2-methoxy-6-polyprenyl-1,4-benzoquinol methylase [Alteromonadaceae bacterium 2753L.S.0a.02]